MKVVGYKQANFIWCRDDCGRGEEKKELIFSKRSSVQCFLICSMTCNVDCCMVSTVNYSMVFWQGIVIEIFISKYDMYSKSVYVLN